MRKVLVPALCASAAAVPAVAFAATDDNAQSQKQFAPASTAPSHELRLDAKHKLDTAVQRAKHERKMKLRAKARERAKARAAAAPAASASPQLEAIAACESGGNPAAIGGGGAYRGKYQFDYGTWASVGGSGDPAAAPEAEQDARAAALLQRSGTSPWPVCG
ncbi:MAG: resuscitation-promoting factor RpfE [Thermoleophilaceae bacterium]|nr:resuscitation-promoting factor RpfE [Thermoleophilaceae bacterium]